MFRFRSAGGLSRRALLKGLAVAGIGGASGTVAHGYLYERHHIELTRETVSVSGLPPALGGLRIGLLTDLHRSQTVAHELIARAVEIIMAERPDLMILGRRLRDVGRSPLRRSGRRGTRRPLGSARRCRDSRQS